MLGELPVGVLGGLISVGLVRAAAVSWQRSHVRQGELAGFWLQLTYDPDEPTADAVVWSVELVHVSHRGRVEGRMYRVYPFY